MKRTVLSLAIAAVIMIGNTALVYSQDYVNTPVTVSKEKVRIDGKVYYSHIVLEKQTMFSISKAYEVSLEDIYDCNPALKNSGLKKNAIILIPVKSVSEEVETVNKKQNDKEQKVHIVRWFEDLESIAEQYGVSVDAIINANKLKGRKLSRKQKLVIPSEEYTPIYEEKTNTEHEKPEIIQSTENSENESDNKIEEESIKENYLFRKSNTQMTLLLPLKADGTSASKNNMDFYSGALIAVKELGEEGININLNVFDIAAPEYNITKEQLGENDVVIGPVSSGNIANILDLSAGNTTIVSPLDPRAEKLAMTNWNLIQSPTPHHILYKELAEWISEEKSQTDSIIFITERGGRDNQTISMMRNAADSAGLTYKTFTYSILEGRDILEPLAGLMTNSGMNRFVVASESEAFVNDVVRNLNLMIHNKYNVTLYAPAKIRSFETMEVENLHNTNLHTCLSYYIDYNNDKVRGFLMKFRALYNAEPTQFAFQGYDIVKYYARLCHRYGRRWTETLDRNDEDMLQSTFKIRRIENGGWVNEGVRRVVYEKNWNVRKL